MRAILASKRLQEEHNWDVGIEPTRRAGHAIELAKEAAVDEVDVVFVMGGDGTVNEAARGLLRSRTALAILPEGHVNIGARETKVPSYTIEAIDAHVNGVVHQMDVGAT